MLGLLIGIALSAQAADWQAEYPVPEIVTDVATQARALRAQAIQALPRCIDGWEHLFARRWPRDAQAAIAGV